MPDAVTDTHALIWYLQDDPRLSAAAASWFDACETDGGQIRVPTICLVEMIYLSEKMRIAADLLSTLRSELAAPDTVLRVVALDDSVIDAITRIPRSLVPDMPDRIITATALSAGLPLLSRDGKIRVSGITTIW